MNEYNKIIECLKKVYSGKNLKEEISKYDSDEKRNKIKNHCYEIIRNYFQINYIIGKFTKHVKQETLIILQIGIYELLYSKKPEYAIINDLVNITKKQNNQSIGKFVNAVLRNYLRNKDSVKIENLNNESIKYNLPLWLIKKIKGNFLTEYENIFKGLKEVPALSIRVNNRKISQVEYLSLLENNNIEYILENNKITLKNYCMANTLPGFNDGLLSIQDLAAQYLIDILDEHKIVPSNVLDACAAPGGKTCQLLENYSPKQLIALDSSESRLRKIQENLERLDLNAKLVCADASLKDWWDGSKYDLIIADVPCSATGTIKRNPDIKINRLESDIEKFVQLQRKIVINLFDLLEEGKYMVYITCSMLHDENQNNIKWFINKIKGFKLIKELQILPDKKSDSLYYALIQKEIN